MLKKQKGQGLVEFALILPLLLLLLLGIVEGARIIWAYITVQTAAREATRYAVTGRPFIDSNMPFQNDDGTPNLDVINICEGTFGVVEPDPISTGVQPWLCEPEDRVDAIKRVALRRGNTLSPSRACLLDTEFAQCRNTTPGAFGVLVVGQQRLEDTNVITNTINYPGDQGLNVLVETFYNVQMLTPIFDLLVGGNFLTLRGASQLQNEGLDSSIGIEPPPPIPSNVGSGNINDDGELPGSTGTIASVSGYTQIEQTMPDFTVRLERHSGGPFDIYLGGDGGTKFKICANKAVDGNGFAQFACDLALAKDPLGSTTLIPPGDYELYSQKTATGERVASAENLVEIIASNNPALQFVDGGGRYPIGAPVEIRLLAHQAPDQPFELALYDSNGSKIKTIATGVSATSAPVAWTVNDDGAGNCSIKSGNKCFIRSLKSDGTLYSQPLDIMINQPSLEVVGATPPFRQGTELKINLLAHAPGTFYDVYIKGGNLVNPLRLGQTVATNDFGDTPYPVSWRIPTSCGSAQGWEDGFYDIISVPAGATTPTLAQQQNLQFVAPTAPYVAVNGGNRWPAGSLINIEVHLHPLEQAHYLNFQGPVSQSPRPINEQVSTGNPGNTFNTNDCGFATVPYRISKTANNGTYLIESFLDSTDAEQAELEISVASVPYIQVLEGETVLPNQTITIELGNHRPSTGYRIKLENNTLIELVTDGDGKARFTYNLANLPADFNVPANYGVLLELFSETLDTTPDKVASTGLILRGADLQVTTVELPPATNLNINSYMPVTITVQNVNTVPIQGWFDTDLYFNPTPIDPSYYKGFNFPGDVKHWESSLAPFGQAGDSFSFTITDTFFAGEYGPQKVHGFADTSNYVLEGELPNQVANPNNVLTNTTEVRCNVPPRVEPFNSLPSGWQTKRYGDATAGSGASIVSGRLQLQNNGTSTWNSNDTSGGELFYYLTSTVKTSEDFNVAVQITTIDRNGSYAKAGIELRNSVESTTSPRVVFGLARDNGGSNYFVQPAYRDGGGMTSADPVNPGDPSDFNGGIYDDFTLGTPVWLRIERLAGSNQFNFYFRESSGSPPATGRQAWKDWWPAQPFARATVDGMAGQLFVGLFHSPYTSNSNSKAQLDNFTLVDALGCVEGQGPPTSDDLPPGLTLCADPIQNQSFEQINRNWQLNRGEGVTFTSGNAKTGDNQLLAPTFLVNAGNPWFYQSFIMPDWVISTTTSFSLNYARRVETSALGNQPADQFYAVVTTNPSSINNAIASRVTTPTLVAQGTSTDPLRWDKFSLPLPIINRSTLEDLAEQTLYLYFYNNSNSQAACSPFCSNKFYFDDVSLSPCTTQPLPEPITTRIKGDLTLNFSDGSTNKLPYVKIWAYTPNNATVYETMTLQDGAFNFYNLPASVAGTPYLIFAQYNLVDAFAPDQIETLFDDTSTILRQNVHTNDTPQQVSLDLFTVTGP
jgi:hypothetical protein